MIVATDVNSIIVFNKVFFFCTGYYCYKEIKWRMHSWVRGYLNLVVRVC